MNLKKAEIPLFVLVFLLLVIIFVLILTGHVVPLYLYAILGALLTGGLGLAVPSSPAPELPAEVSALVGDLRKVFAALEAPAAPVATAPAPSSTAPPGPTTLTTVTTAPPPVAS